MFRVFISLENGNILCSPRNTAWFAFFCPSVRPSLIKGRICVADPPHPRVGRICNGNRELDGAPKKRARFHHHRNYGFSVHCDPWDPCRLFFRKRNERKRKTCSISPVIRNVFIVSTLGNKPVLCVHKLRFPARNITPGKSQNSMYFHGIL